MEEIERKAIPSHPTAGVTIIWPALIAAVVKLLLIPAYRSTDFEVHRHWLAITNTLPLNQWYTDTTSEWTLDYPPFFAYFEKMLSLIARRVDPTMTDLYAGLDYQSQLTIIFQRLSVILSDVVLIYGVWRLTRNRTKAGILEKFVVWVLVIWSPGLLMVDHVHFQYNGFLMGWLILSLGLLVEGRNLMGGFVFAVLVCFKHLFAVAGPVYFVYLLRGFCFRKGKNFVGGLGRLMAMGGVVVGVLGAAFGPFLYNGQILQVLRRLFPFGRGLCHAYWAPNFWVLYIVLDKFLTFGLKILGFNIQSPAASFTGGLVGDSSPFAVLPTITPLITFLSVLLALSPCLVKTWRNPQPRMVLRWVSYAYTCGFLFGWHVHEKASLHFVIPLTATALESTEDAKHYFYVSIVSCYSLFPLLFGAQEYPIKVVLFLLYALVMYFAFTSLFPYTTGAAAKGDKETGLEKNRGFRIGRIGKFYLLGIVVVEIWAQFLHRIVLGDRLPFLPLMIISISCSLGMIYSWLWQLRKIWFD